MWFMSKNKLNVPTPDQALPGRDQPMPVPDVHHVNGHPLRPPFPEGLETAMFAMGCFWGAERKFWQAPGVFTTAVGYAAGHTRNPTYAEVCSGMTGHTEAVLVVFDPKAIGYEDRRRRERPRYARSCRNKPPRRWDCGYGRPRNPPPW